jgi:hypothetical protein
MSTENQPITVLSVYTTYAWTQPVGSSGGFVTYNGAGPFTTLQTFDAGINTPLVNPTNLAALDLANTTYSLFGGAAAVNIGKNMTSGRINVLGTGTATFDVNGDGIKSNKIRQLLTTDTLTIGNGGPLTINAKNTTSGVCPVIGDQLEYYDAVAPPTTLTAYCPTNKLEVDGVYGLRLYMTSNSGLSFGANKYSVNLTARNTEIPSGTTGLTTKYFPTLSKEYSFPNTQVPWTETLYGVIRVESTFEYLAVNIVFVTPTAGRTITYYLQVTRLA